MLFGCGLRLLHDGPSQRSAIFLGTVALFEWADDDGATRRLVQAQLVNAKLATRVAVANVFGLHVNTVSRIARQVAVEGVEATVRRKPGPHGARKVSPAVVAELQRAVEAGLSTRAAQREVRHRLGVALS